MVLETPFGGWEYLIDANTLEPREKTDLLVRADGSGYVYDDNPLKTPSLQRRTFKYLNTSLRPGTFLGDFADIKILNQK